MRFLFVLILLVKQFNVLAQDKSSKVYPWKIARNANPDTIFGISFERMKLKEVPSELKEFKHLKSLNFSHNKLSTLPEFIGNFPNLRSLNISKNNFVVFPVAVCQIKELRLRENSQ